MTKHFIGFGIFSFIVGFFALAFWVFTPKLIPEVYVLETRSGARPKTYCDLNRRSQRLSEPRAMADRKNGAITIYLNEIPGGSHVDANEISASFTFYAVRGDEVRVVDVIHDSLVSQVRRDAGPKWILQYSADWVKGLTWEDTLYVMPGVSYGSNNQALASAFSKDRAMAVLITN